MKMTHLIHTLEGEHIETDVLPSSVGGNWFECVSMASDCYLEWQECCVADNEHFSDVFRELRGDV